MARQNDRLHLIGCMLYWAEGSKERNSAGFANSDVNMTKLFVKFLRKCYHLKAADITVKVNCYLDHGLSLSEVENWWLKKLNLPSTSLRKGTVAKPRGKPRTLRKRKLKYGVCTVKVNKSEIVQSIFGAIQEYSWFKNDGWLDC